MSIVTGTIVPYSGSGVPSGFLLCDGSAVSRTTYATLFGVIGTTYGAGNGTTTFNIPDLRGRIVAQPTFILSYLIATQDVLPSNIAVSSVGTVVDGGGFTLTTGLKGYIYCPFAGTITAATLIANASGSIVVDVWKSAYSTLPTVANSITASDPPTLSSAQTSQDTSLSGWTTSVAAGDVFAFNVNSVSNITRIMLSLTVQRS